MRPTIDGIADAVAACRMAGMTADPLDSDDDSHSEASLDADGRVSDTCMDTYWSDKPYDDYTLYAENVSFSATATELPSMSHLVKIDEDEMLVYSRGSLTSPGLSV